MKNTICKLCAFICAAVFSVALVSFAGCENKKNDKISVVCSIFPAYDWALNITGESSSIELTLLIKSGVDLHSYQPSVSDIISIAECDLFVYVGGESDKWVSKVLEQNPNPDRKTIAMVDYVNALDEEIVEGMEGEAGEEEAEKDEHVWLSLKNASAIVSAIAAEIEKIDSANEAVYAANAAEYKGKIDALENNYAQSIAASKKNALLFADRFPFRYLVNDYNIEYYAAFVGCSAETEASTETIAFLAGKVDELSLKYVLVTESSDRRIADTVIHETIQKNQTILVMDSCQSVNAQKISGVYTYLSVMTENLATLILALG